jgi:hypothetical protein
MRWKPTEEFRRLIPDFVVFGCLVFVTGLLLFSHFIVVRRFPASKPIFWMVIGAILGMTLAAIAYRARKKHWLFRILDPLPTEPEARNWWLFGVFAAAAIASIDNLRHITDILDHHGSFFDWIIGSATVVGIWLTYNTITESQRIIRSFPQLQSRMIDLAKKTPADGSAGDLRFLAYTASIGFLALKEEQWNLVKQCLDPVRDRNQLKVICLDDDDLTQWHNQYVGRTTSRKPSMGGTTLSLKDTLEATRASTDRANDAPTTFPQDLTDLKRRCKKRKFEMMPGFYLMFNDRKAIIVCPFFVPHHALAINDPSSTTNTKRVQMFGFETSDLRTIEDVTTLFGYYWKDEHQQLRHFDSKLGDLESLNARMKEQLDHWTSQYAGKGKLFRYRLLIVEEDLWEAIRGTLRQKFGEGDYETYLSASVANAGNGKLSVYVETDKQKHWIDDNCTLLIEEVRTQLKMDMPIEIAVRPPHSTEVKP